MIYSLHTYRLNNAEQSCSTIEKKLLAIIYCNIQQYLYSIHTVQILYTRYVQFFLYILYILYIRLYIENKKFNYESSISEITAFSKKPDISKRRDIIRYHYLAQ